MTLYINVCVFIFGACIGSFLNAVAYRLPRQLSLVHSRSRCSRCYSVISWYDNIPLLSCLWLFARCRKCKAGFGWGHVVVELLCGYVLLTVYRRFGISPSGFYLFLLFCALVVVWLVDVEFRIIPDEISLGGLAVSLGLAAWMEWNQVRWWISLPDSLMGAVLGGLSLYAINFVYEKLRGQTGIGFGDVKLLAFMGANCGPRGVLTTIFIASLLGSIIGILLIATRRGSPWRKFAIPFGPYLCIGFFIAMHDLQGQITRKIFNLL